MTTLDNVIRKPLKTPLLLATLVSSFIFCFLLTHPTIAAPVVGFNAGRIIDDAIFTNKNSMSVGQIQAFFNAKGASCTNGEAPCLKNYSEGGKSAAQIIFDTGQQYNINPQALIVTLQKEVGLVTANQPANWRYRTAMGYGCPDSTPGVCNANYYGFSNQVRWAATMYNAIMTDSPTWYTPYILGNNSILWNPNSSCGSSTVYIENKATKALYNYTPYRPNQAALNAGYDLGDSCSSYGNRNFYQYFKDWFGSPTGTRIVKADSSPVFYLLNSGTRQPIPSYDTYVAYGFDKIETTVVTQDYLNTIPLGNTLTNVFSDTNGNIQIASGGRRYTMTMDTCTAWGLQCFNPYIVATLDPYLLTFSQWNGYTPFIMNYQGVVYRLNQGKKEPFLNEKAVQENGFSMSSAIVVDGSLAAQPLGRLLPSDLSVLRLPDSRIVLATDNLLINVGAAQFYAWKFDSIYYPVLPVSEWNSTAPTLNGSLTTNFIGFGTTKILVDSGRKLDVSSSSSEWPAATEASPYMGKLLNRLPLGVANSSSCYRSEKGDIYAVRGEQRRSFALYDDLYRFGCRPESLIGVYDSSVPMLSRGPVMLTSNRMFKETGGQNIYMQTGQNSSELVSDYLYLIAFNQQPHDVAQVSNSDVSHFAVGGSVKSLAGNAALQTYFLHSFNGYRYYFDSATLAEWGINKNQIPTYDSRVGSMNISRSATRFARTTDGTIYYAQGGTARRVGSYDTFVRLGGNSQNTMDVLNDFISSSPVGQILN